MIERWISEKIEDDVNIWDESSWGKEGMGQKIRGGF